MSQKKLLHLESKSLSLTRKDDGTEIRLAVAGRIAVDTTFHYEDIYLHITLLGQGGQVLAHEESSIDVNPTANGDISFAVREYIPYALAHRAKQVRIAAIARVFSPDKTTTLSMDAVLSEANTQLEPTPGQEFLVFRRRADSDGEVRLRVVGNAVFDPSLRYEQQQMVISLLDPTGSVLYTDDTYPEIYGGTQSPTPYQASVYAPDASVSLATTLSIRQLSRALVRSEPPPFTWSEDVIDLSANVVESASSAEDDVFGAVGSGNGASSDEDDFFG